MAEEMIVAPRHIAPVGARELARLDDSPTREIRAGLAIAALFFVLFLGWAALFRLDAAAIASGHVTVSGQRQTVQHRDGGVIGAIFVTEGQKVRKGQVLLRVAAAEVQAQERALAAQVIGLLAQRARLRAEQLGLATIPVPPEFAALSPRDRADAAAAMRGQQIQLQSRSSLLSTQQGVLGQQREQAGDQGEGYHRQLEAIKEQERLIGEELDSLRGVAEKGFVSKNRIRALERVKADLGGQRGRLQAAISQSSASVGETRLRIVETERTLQEKVASDLRDVEFSLGDLMPKWKAARDQVARTEVRAPATGTIVGTTVFTVGGVIAAGQKLMDVVPDKAAMVIEARFSPNDVDDLRIGQSADIQFSGIRDGALPPLRGIVTRLSADSFVDDRTGASFFTGEVVVPPDQIAVVQRERGQGFSLKPGMPVEIMVPLRKRTALDYLMEPLTHSFGRSFRED